MNIIQKYKFYLIAIPLSVMFAIGFVSLCYEIGNSING